MLFGTILTFWWAARKRVGSGAARGSLQPGGKEEEADIDFAAPTALAAAAFGAAAVAVVALLLILAMQLLLLLVLLHINLVCCYCHFLKYTKPRLKGGENIHANVQLQQLTTRKPCL